MVNHKPKFTIWVINYNQPELTLMTVRSMRTRYLCDLFLINTGEIPDYEKFSDLYDLVDSHFKLENKSLARTWNWIFKASLTDYNFVFNNDVLLSEYTIDTLWDNRQKAGVVSCYDISNKMPLDKSILPHLYVLDEWPHFHQLRIDNGLDPEADFSGFLMNKSTWRKTGGFNEKYKIAYFEDLDFKQRLWEKKINYCAIKEAVFYHIGQQSSNQKAHLQPYYAKNKARYHKIWNDKVVRLNCGGLNTKKWPQLPIKTIC